MGKDKGYSPDLNPIERLWEWMREEVMRGVCHGSVARSIAASRAFLERIGRLWPKFELDPEFEDKLRVFT